MGKPRLRGGVDSVNCVENVESVLLGISAASH